MKSSVRTGIGGGGRVPLGGGRNDERTKLLLFKKRERGGKPTNGEYLIAATNLPVFGKIRQVGGVLWPLDGRRKWGRGGSPA